MTDDIGIDTKLLPAERLRGSRDRNVRREFRRKKKEDPSATDEPQEKEEKPDESLEEPHSGKILDITI
jgi:hypothetical protein